MFSTNPLMRQGLSRSEAESTALERAKEFRQELLKQGILKEPVTKDEPQSPVVGVSWQKELQKWKVEIDVKGRKIYGGCFGSQVEAELKAQEMWRHAVPHATEDPVPVPSRPALSADAAADERPQRSYPGVCWIRRDRCWWASVSVQKVRKHFRSKPKDGSEEELNRSFQEVVAWLEHQKATRETRDEAPRPRKCPRPERPVFFADGGDEEPQKKRPRGGRCVGLPHFQPKEPHPGVCWMPSEQCWKAEFRKNGLRVKTRSKPKDHSEEELERSFQEAVRWLKQQKAADDQAVPAVAAAPAFDGAVCERLAKSHKGICWAHQEGCWKAERQVKGLKKQFKVKPKSSSREELERAFQEAVAWLRSGADAADVAERRAPDVVAVARCRRRRRKVEPKEKQRGICWAQREACWIARLTDPQTGQRRFRRARPSELTEEKIEEALLS